MNVYGGSCHCSAIKVALRSLKTGAELGARSCQCSFCRAHGASWTSDAGGALEIEVTGPVSRYRFGTGTAEFLICATCGVVPAVIWQDDERLLGVVRVDCLQERSSFLAHAAPTDFEGEGVEQRLARRSQKWTPAAMKDAAGSLKRP